jgi:hypothetical protein
MDGQLSIRPEDALKGQQLTEQYHRATGGMKEVLIFGAMMMQLRELHPELAQKGGDRRSKSTVDFERVTLRDWLHSHAPEVKYATAQRFLAVTQSVATDYAQIVGPKAAKAMPLPELVTTPAKQLDEHMQSKQLELFEWVNGTSQKSWLDKFMPRKLNHPPKPTKASAAKRKANAADETLQAAELMKLTEEHIETLEQITLAAAFKAADTERLAAMENAVDALKQSIADELKTRRKAK